MTIGLVSRAALAALLALALAALAVWPAPAPAQLLPLGSVPVIAAAGDIACDPNDANFNNGEGTARRCRQKHTAELLAGLDVAAVLALGDIQYEDSKLWKFQLSYNPTWGRFKAITRPVAGNHEYFADDGGGYFDYFNGTGSHSGPAGDRDKGYYSFDVGGWHLIALNSVCHRVGGCGPGSPQERWLRADLAAHPANCTLAFFHHPQRTSVGQGWPSVDPLFRVLYDAGAEIVLNGHSHNYERFAPLDDGGRPDPAHGIRQFVVGSGGKSLTQVVRRHRYSEAMNTTDFGVLTLALRPDGYDWSFLSETTGGFSDSGSGACHGPPPPRVPEATTGPATGVRGTAARLTAAIEPHHQPVTYRFEYGPTTRYGSTTADVPVLTGYGEQPAAARITGLVPGREYHYRVVVTGAAGTAGGADRTFTADARSAYSDAVERTDGVLAYWRFDEPAGRTAFDVLGRTLGQYRGDHVLDRAGALALERDPAAAFDGTSGSMRAYGPSIGRTGTLEGWFRWEEGDVLMRDDSATGGWYLAREGRNRLTYRVAGRTYRTERQISTVRDGAWRHVALTKDGPVARLYVDGRLVHEALDVPDAAATMPWYVMRNGPFNEHARGRADEVAVYGRALAEDEVRRNYRLGMADRAPRTTITDLPRATHDPTPAFRLRARGSRRPRFRCAMPTPERPNPALRACRARTVLPFLADGVHRFTAYAIDSAGRPDPTPVVRAFTVDTVVPELTATVPRARLRSVLRRRLLTASATCSEACAFTARATLAARTAKRAKLTRRLKPFVIARGRATGAAAAERRIHLRIPARVARRLRRARTLPLTVTVVARDAAGNRQVARVGLTVRR